MRGSSPRARRSCTPTTRASTRSPTPTGSTPPYFPAELAATDRLVGALLDALPADVALRGHRRPRAGAGRAGRLARPRPARPDGRDLRGRRPVPVPARAARAPRPTCSRRREQLHGGRRLGVPRASSCSTRGGSGPTRCRPRTAASATSCSRPRTGVGLRRPDAALRGAARSPPTDRSPPAEMQVPLVAWPAAARALTSANYTRVIHPQALWRGCGRGETGASEGATLAKSFVHLHLHTEFSMLDGAARIQRGRGDGRGRRPARGRHHRPRQHVRRPRLLPRRARGRPHAGHRHRGLHGHHEPATTGRGATSTTSTTSRCWRRSTQGYRNLIKVSSHAYLDGFFQKPRVDFELLEQHHEGLVGTTGCLGGAVSQAILLRTTTSCARQHVDRFQSIFGRDSFFVELQDHGLPEQLQVNPQLIRLARDMRAPLLATNDSHYTHRDDAEAHDALLCVQTGAHPRRPEALQVRRRRVLPEDRGGDARPLLRLRGGVRQHAAHRRARQRRDRVRQLGAADVPDAAGSRRRLLPARAVHRGRQGALRDLARSRGARAHRVRARRHQDDGVLRVLPRRVGPRALRARRAASGWVRGGGARRARASPTACASSTSTRSGTTCCSSGSSTRAASRCPTSTWTSTPATAAR